MTSLVPLYIQPGLASLASYHRSWTDPRCLVRAIFFTAPAAYSCVYIVDSRCSAENFEFLTWLFLFLATRPWSLLLFVVPWRKCERNQQQEDAYVAIIVAGTCRVRSRVSGQQQPNRLPHLNHPSWPVPIVAYLTSDCDRSCSSIKQWQSRSMTWGFFKLYFQLTSIVFAWVSGWHDCLHNIRYILKLNKSNKD
jgi:hypothetical protein